MKYFILTNLLDTTFSIGGRVYNKFTVGYIISITCVLVSTKLYWSYFNACSLCKTRYCLLDCEMCLLFKPWYWQRPHSYHITLPHICIRVMKEVGPDSWTKVINSWTIQIFHTVLELHSFQHVIMTEPLQIQNRVWHAAVRTSLQIYKSLCWRKVYSWWHKTSILYRVSHKACNLYGDSPYTSMWTH